MSQVDPGKLQTVCNFINDMIADTPFRAFPGDGAIAWEQVYPKGRYRLSQKQAYKRLYQAGYNPMRLVEFVAKKEGLS